MADEVGKVLEVLSQRFGTTVEHLWGILVKQAYVEGVQYVIWGFFWLAIVVGCVIGLRLAERRYTEVAARAKLPGRNVSEDDSSMTVIRVVQALLCLAGAIAIGTALDCFMDAAAYMINPEYQAIKSVLTAVTPKK